MINITIHTPTGKKDAFAREAEAEYAKRLSRTARIRHARLDLAPAQTLWFDPTGEVMDSPGLARVIQDQLLGGNELHLALGKPPQGDAPCIQLVSLPLPEPMLQVLLLEQIYRAFKILAGEPYHK